MSKISSERKTIYYVGNAISVLGLLIFISIFVTSALNFGNFNNFDEQSRSFAFRGVCGMILMMVGKVISKVGAQGLAGSGVLLDPEKAREDLKPYSHQAGGMLSDTLDKAELGKHLGSTGSTQTVVIKCRDCSFLNEEDSKFCQECGSKM